MYGRPATVVTKVTPVARAEGNIIAVADIESGSAGVAIIELQKTPKLLALSREALPLEERTNEALASGVIQQLTSAAEKALAQFSAGEGKGKQVSSCYCVVGSPWTRSYAGDAASRFDQETAITDEAVGALAKQALAGQKNIDSNAVFEANVVRVLLNGYPTEEPAGKRAREIKIFTLTSDCDPAIKAGAQEALGKSFPGAGIVWRSSARANLVVARKVLQSDTSLIVEVGAEATDLISVRKGVLLERTLIPQGVRQMVATLAKGKPVEETLALFEMLEKEQGESGAFEELRQSIAKAEPELVHVFGEALAKLSAARKLPEQLILIAPTALVPWLSRFFTRIDFTQFTVTTKPFTVTNFSASELSGIPRNDPAIFADAGLSIACGLVNMELSS